MHVHSLLYLHQCLLTDHPDIYALYESNYYYINPGPDYPIGNVAKKIIFLKKQKVPVVSYVYSGTSQSKLPMGPVELVLILMWFQR